MDQPKLIRMRQNLAELQQCASKQDKSNEYIVNKRMK